MSKEKSAEVATHQFSQLVCPICKSSLEVSQEELICHKDNLSFPINNGIAVLLSQEARDNDTAGSTSFSSSTSSTSSNITAENS